MKNKNKNFCNPQVIEIVDEKENFESEKTQNEITLFG